MRLLSVLQKFRRLTAAQAFMKALDFPWFVVKVRPLCSRGSLEAVEAGIPDRASMVRQVLSVFTVSKGCCHVNEG